MSSDDAPGTTTCPGCRREVPDVDGPVHAYLEAAPACWADFTTVLASDYSDAARWPVHRLTVDAYAVQHQGRPSTRTRQSLVLHLVTLWLQLEEGLDLQAATAAARRLAERRPQYLWLEPPAEPSWLTVDHVLGAADAEDHRDRVRAWAASVWTAWAEHHGTVRSYRYAEEA